MKQRVLIRFAVAVQEGTSLENNKTPMGWIAEQEETGDERMESNWMNPDRDWLRSWKLITSPGILVYMRGDRYTATMKTKCLLLASSHDDLRLDGRLAFLAATNGILCPHNCYLSTMD